MKIERQRNSMSPWMKSTYRPTNSDGWQKRQVVWQDFGFVTRVIEIVEKLSDLISGGRVLWGSFAGGDCKKEIEKSWKRH